MIDPLEVLLADGVVDEVLARLKSGKEADVWLVRHAGEVVAAKVYRARHARSFKNDAAYKEGRQVRNSRTQRAMDRGSRFGKAAAEDAWKTREADALYRLHAAGLHVPRPVLFYEGVLLMELVLDAHGGPAPRLADAPIAPEEAAQLYAVLRSQVVGMLACDLIHGDLSPYNVLLGASGPVVIDFPQVVGAAHNSQAETFFLRDLRNIHQFFAALDPALGAAARDGNEIWRAYLRRELTPDFVPTGRVAEPQRPPRPHGGGRPPHAQRGGSAMQPGSRPHAHGQRPAGQPGLRSSAQPGAGPHAQPGPRPPAQPGSRPQGERLRGAHAAGSPPQLAGSARGDTRPDDARRGQGRGGAQGRPGGDRRGGDPRRQGSMPEVIRVERPPRTAPGPDAHAARGSAPGQGSPGGGANGRGGPDGRAPDARRPGRWSRRRR